MGKVKRLVDRLRDYPRDRDGNFDKLTYLLDGNEAADRIEALEAELAAVKVERDVAKFGEAHQTELKHHARKCCDAAETRLSEMEKEVERLQAWKVEALKALEPFAWIGQWLFARDLPDDTPMVTIEGAGKSVNLTRGMFKDAHTARRLVEGGGDG